MEGRNKKMELLGSAPIPKALLAMGLPTMIGMMINALYNLVDAYFVGGLGTSQMGAISVAFPLGQAVVGLGLLSWKRRGVLYIQAVRPRRQGDCGQGGKHGPVQQYFCGSGGHPLRGHFFEAPVKMPGSWPLEKQERGLSLEPAGRGYALFPLSWFSRRCGD